MNLHNYKKAPNNEVRDWLIESFDMTYEQCRKFYHDDILDDAPFEFFKEREKTENFWIRLTVIAYPIVWILLFIGMPFNFIITGKWGYDGKLVKFLTKWLNSIGL